LDFPCAPSAVSLSDDQLDALEQIERTIADRFSQICVIHGLAGTGKTYTLDEAGRRYPKSKIVAPTNKAADVLRRRIGRHAGTIHSLFYRYKQEIIDKQTGRKRLIFEKVQSRGALRGEVVMIDEAFMVAGEIANDLVESGAKLIAFGDPGQLPPIGGESFFNRPDVRLRQIHRQAADSAIIRQAYQVRHHGYYEDDGADFRVEKQLTDADLAYCDVALCYKRATRHELNRQKRKILGLSGDWPSPDELVLCHTNRPKLGIFNGATYRVIDCNQEDSLMVLDIDGDEIEVGNACFGELDDPQGTRPIFSFAYAITVHKAQGSEWDNVLVVDEFPQSDENRRRWVYTAITRASRSVLMVKNL
jgi:exodeoxyribonuclease V